MNFNGILFWTEKDDSENDETSSRDPLGTETFAGQLAELILPGLTTITWRVRYLTLICLWLRCIKEELKEDNADKILEHIKNLEKLTTYCIIKQYNENEDNHQTAYLIGRRYANAYFKKNMEKFSIDRKHFPFLVNHGSVGAFTTYKVLLKVLGYIEDDDEYTLTPDGMDLIEGLQIPHALFVKNILKGEKTDAHSKKFDSLGEFFDLSNFKIPEEKKRLRYDLLANVTRKTTFMLIKKNLQESEFDTISKISKTRPVAENEKSVITICDYITRFEKLNREIHYIFYFLMDMDANQIDIRDFLKKPNTQECLSTMTGKALDDYMEFHASNEQILGKYDKRPYELFIQLKECRNDNEQCIKIIIEHHVNNQKQKTKAPWIDHKDGKCTVILSQYRKNIEEVERIREMAVHSYRTSNAWKMIHELAI
ncbi:MAG: hypothetical protein U0586_00830 [Candidatus Brocadiaceae bacterium]